MHTRSTSTARFITRLLKFMATGLIPAILLAACQNPESKVDAAKENVANAAQDLKEATREMRAEWQADWLQYKRENDEGIAENERSIIALRGEVNDIDLRYRGKYTTLIDDIERRNNELRDRVNNYKDQGDEAWEEFKKDISRDMDDLTSARKNITVRNG